MKRSIAASLVALFVLAGVTAQPALADPPSVVAGTLPELLAAVPVLPKMEIAFRQEAFPNLVPRESRSGDPIDFGTGSSAGRALASPIFSARAAWAAGGYGWPVGARQSFGLSSDSPWVSSQGALEGSPLTGAPWSSPMPALEDSLARTVSKKCRRSSSLVCVVEALPTDLRSRAAVAVLLTVTRHRLAMSAEEKEVVRRWITPAWTSEPDVVFSVQTTDVPSLPTTYDSDAAGTVVSERLFGVLAPPETGSFPTVPYSGLRLWDSGVAWRDIEPRPGVFKWRVLDSAIDFANRNGKEVLLVLGPVPQWASAQPDRPDESWGPGAGGPLNDIGQERFSKYVDAVLDRYGNRISAIEVWNEANLPTFWRGTPKQMAQMTGEVHGAVASRGLDIRVYSASATTRVAGSIYRFFPSYLAELASLGWPVDGFAVHAYPDADGTASDMAGLVAQFKAYLAIAGAPDLPIANTELNYGLAGPGDKPHVDVPKAESQGWLARTFLDSVRLGLQDTYWFAWTPKYYGQLGIQLHPGTKDTITAWSSIHSWLVGATFHGCSEPDGAVLCEFSREEVPFWIGYADAAALVSAPEGVGRVCELSGRCTGTLGSKVVLGVRPVLLTKA